MIELLLGGWDNIRSICAQKENMNWTFELRKVDALGDIGDFKKKYFLPGYFKSRINFSTTPNNIVIQNTMYSQNEYSQEEVKIMQELFNHIHPDKNNFHIQARNRDREKYEMLLHHSTNERVPHRVRERWMKYIYELEEEKDIDYNLDEYYKILKPFITFTKEMETNINYLLKAHEEIGRMEKGTKEKVVLFAPSSITGIDELCIYSDKTSQEVQDIVFIEQA